MLLVACIAVAAPALGAQASAWHAAAAQPHPREVRIEELTLARDWLFHLAGQPFSGVAVAYHNSGAAHLAERTQMLNGKRHGPRERWFADGRLASRAHYRHGRLHGLGESYWSNGKPRARAHYHGGKPHGVSTQWYREGMKFKEQRLDHGVEHGLQRAWRRNGKLYINYEAVNDRTFGLKQPNLCLEVR